MHMGLLERSDNLLPSKEALQERLVASSEKAAKLMALVPNSSKEITDADKIAAIGDTRMYSMTWDKLKKAAEADSNVEIVYDVPYGQEPSGWTIEDIEEFEEPYADENRYLLIRKTLMYDAPDLLYEGDTFEPGQQFDLNVMQGSFILGFESGMVYIVDREAGELVCARKYSAGNSSDITYDPYQANAALTDNLMQNVWAGIRSELEKVSPELNW